ncbi:MAG: glycerol-3-phosphate dehydrogenase [Rhodobacteraceae bacterium]|nr:glycerol-3-phosphate dehydrogenase [Paracoccaceae bacterium]
MDTIADILVIGGGVNGAGIARDASGRGLSVILCEQGDLASATSSASTKLFHGGLRYLESYDFRLVRKALIEREVLLANMPHISHPMRFVLPHMQGMRPKWLLRLGLFLYDHLGGRKRLPGTRVLDLRQDKAGRALKPGFRTAFEYSDGWVNDARLVVLNARDAADRGADIRTRTKVMSARRDGGNWLVTLRHGDTDEQVRAKVLINAAGPWVNIVMQQALGATPPDPLRLVRGSHIVVPRLFDHDRAYFFQNADGRIMFAIPYHQDFTVIGTTDVDHTGDPSQAACSDAEIAYLCSAASEYFAAPVRPADVVWTFSGVRPLDDAGGGKASAASRDYHIRIESGPPPLLTIYGGKITTYRKLAEQAVEHLGRWLELSGHAWTGHAPLPGGDFEFDGRAALTARLMADYPFLAANNAARLIAAYGTDTWRMLGNARSAGDLGRDFGAGLSEVEIRWMIAREWAVTAEDILWRRSKCGLAMDEAQIAALENWLKET